MKWLALWLLLLASCQKAEREPLTIEAYVWQSPARPEVRAAIGRAVDTVQVFHIRAAELKWTGETFAVQRTLIELPTPGCGLVVRIGASASQLEWTPAQIESVAAVFRDLAALRPTEIQCDYDCPQKRLASYQVLLDALDSAAGPVPVLPTALPSWLDEPEFPKLIAGRAGYVLQVHSLQLPKQPGEPGLIFDPVAARTAATKASALTIPFRIAMATYGCEVRFDAGGAITDVVSEDRSSAPAATRSFMLADPSESARLVREWSVDPPPGLQGLIWYRLPIEGDRRNWPWETFQLVVRGESEAATAGFEARSANGAMDLYITNHGRFPVRIPAEIIIENSTTAADGLGAYHLETRGGILHFMRKPDVWPWLDPGKKISAGWLRLRDHSETLQWSFH